ncbi:ribonuclease III [Mycoplasma sp. 394]
MFKQQHLIDFLINIGIQPNHIEFYELATTHKSYNTHDKTKLENYERLEYLGDSLLSFMIAIYAYKKFPNKSQGELSRWRASAVQTETLGAVSKNIGLLKFLKTGNGQMHTDVLDSPKVQADIFEAFLGAIYLDQGMSKAWWFVQKHLLASNISVDGHHVFQSNKDPKTQLQEYFQSISKNNIHYIFEEKDKLFIAKAVHEDMIYGIGSGASKKEATTNAARAALNKMKMKGNDEIN